MKIGIVGAGVIGLTAGYELVKAGHDVTIFESESNYGGLMSTIEVGDEKLEKLYHHIFTSDTEIIALINELGLTNEMTWQAPKSGMFMNNKLYPFSSPVDLLLFKELSFVDRITMGLLIFRAKFLKDWKSIEDTGAKEWIIQKAGRNVYYKVWEPLIYSKFDNDSDKISAVWIWNKFKLRGSTRGKNINRELFGYLLGSFGLIYDKLANIINEAGGKIYCSTPVKQIKQLDNKSIEIASETGTYKFDRVIVTTAPQIIQNIIPSLPVQYLEKLNKIDYKSNLCVMLELTEKLSPYYWITVADNNLPFVLYVEHTNLVPSYGYKSHIVYLSRYLDHTNELFSATDEYVIDLFTNSLNQIFPNYDKSKLKGAKVFRERFSQPVVGKEYSKIKPDYNTPIENLYLAGMAQIYPQDRGQNYSIKMGKEISKIVSNLS